MKRSILAAVAALAAAAAGALDLDAAAGRFGVAIVYNDSDTGNAVVNTLGGGVAVSFRKGFFLTLQPSLDFYYTTYEWTDGRAVPTPAETGGGNNAFVAAFVVDLPITASLRFNDRLGAAASIGPAFALRAAFANDDTPEYADEMAANLAAMVSYFWSSGRWFYPSASLRLEVYLQQNFTFAFGAKGFLPLFNAWTGHSNFWDQSVLQISMAMLIGLD